MAADSPIDAAREVVSDIIRSSGGAPSSLWEHVEALAHAVDWSEPWIRAIGAVHLCLAAVAVLGRRSWGAQAGVLGVCMATVWSAPWLNAAGAQRWREFAGQDYFDEQGLFVSAVVCLPMCLVSLFVLLNGICTSSRLLVDVKRLQFQAEARRKAAASGRAAGGGKKKQKQKRRRKED